MSSYGVGNYVITRRAQVQAVGLPHEIAVGLGCAGIGQERRDVYDLLVRLK